jgi:opacity protein-like surface antigen
MVTGLLYPIPILYGAVGAGWYNSSFEYDAARIGVTIEGETKQQFGWHFGGGVELPIGSNAKLVGDIRYVFLNYDFKQIPGTSGLDSDFYVITAGLLFRL